MRRRSLDLTMPRGARRGVTLIEVVLSMGLLVVVSSMTYWFYASVLETTRSETKASHKLRLARVVLDRMATEIRQASAVTIDSRVGIRGDGERIWLSTYRVPSREQGKAREIDDDPARAEYDVTKVEYRITRHEEILHEDGWERALGLARVEVLIPRPDHAQLARRRLEAGDALPADDGGLYDEAGEGEEAGDVDLGPQINWDELYSPEIRYLRICYYDGHQWWDRWEVTGENPLPQLVQLTIGFDEHPSLEDDLGDDEVNEEFCECQNEDPVDCVPLTPDQFSRVVRVTQSDPLFRSRVSRETQALVEELAAGEEEEGTEP